MAVNPCVGLRRAAIALMTGDALLVTNDSACRRRVTRAAALRLISMSEVAAKSGGAWGRDCRRGRRRCRSLPDFGVYV